MRSSNLRPAPRWITPDVVKRVLDLAMPAGATTMPVFTVPTRGVKPALEIVRPPIVAIGPDDHDEYPGEVNDRAAKPPVTHSGRPDEDEAAIVAPHAATSLRRATPAPPWTPEEDERLRVAYECGERIDHVAEELGRPYKGTLSRADKLGFSHPRDIKGGFITKPKWSVSEDALLRSLYGEIPTKELPARIPGRSLRSIYQRAFDLDLKHGCRRQWTKTEFKALKIGFGRGLAVADVAETLGRKTFSVSKYATTHGYSFGRRPLLEEPITLETLLRLADPAIPLPRVRDRAGDARAATEERRAQRELEAQQRRRDREAACAAAAARHRAEREAREAETRRQREIAAADRRKSKPNAIREVTPAAICRPAVPVPSREPALPAPQQARAQPVTIVRERPNAPRHINYAERMNAAIAHLRARNFVVQRHNRDELIARWHVSGWTGLFSNEQLVALAQHHGLELRA